MKNNEIIKNKIEGSLRFALNLGPSVCHQSHVAAGCFWLLLAAFGCFWLLLAAFFEPKSQVTSAETDKTEKPKPMANGNQRIAYG